MDDLNLANLISKKLYNEWSQGVNRSSYLKHCSYFPSAPDNLHENISELCRKLLRNLEGMEYKGNEECYNCGRCKLLNYWLYDQVKKILSFQHKNKYREIITKIHEAWSEHKISQIKQLEGFKFIQVEVKPQCQPENLIPTFEDIEDKKNIHEHCLNYYKISKNNFNNVECQKYKTYIQNMTSLYDKFKDLFSENDKEKCSIYYDKCYSYNPENILGAKNCPQDFESAAVPVAKDDQEVTTTIQAKEGEVPPIQQEYQQSLSSNGADERVPAEGENPDLKEKGDRLTQRSNERAKPANAERQPPVLKQEQPSEGDGVQVPLHADGIQQNPGRHSGGLALPAGDMGHAEGDHEIFTSSTNNPPNIMPVGLSLFGIASFSTILYKFTPLRSVFYKLIHKNKSPINHQHEVPKELLEYMITSGSNNRDNRPNYIAYHPA